MPTMAEQQSPRRVRVQGDLFHGRVPARAIYVGRRAPGLPASPWANPFRPGKLTPVTVYLGGHPWTVGHPLAGCWPPDLESAVAWYRSLVEHTELHDQIRAELAGRDLACWCPLAGPCHADVLLEVANS